MARLLLALFASLSLLAAACGDDDEGAAPTTDDTTTTTGDSDETTTTQPEEPTATWERCENPAGFAVSYPASWETNDGSVTTACSQFDPDPFSVPEATDERVAAITAYVDPVDFNEVAAPGDEESDRAVTSVDGHQAVRTIQTGSELYGEDTEITMYTIDLALGVDDGPGTLFIDVVDTAGVDYASSVRVMDRMVRTIDLTVADRAPDDVVARYEGAAPFSAALDVEAGEPCLTTPTQGEPTTRCFTLPGPDAVRAADYSAELFAAFGGAAGADVFRIDIDTESGTFSYLPVAVGGPVRGWAAPIEGASVERLTWFGLDGAELGSRSYDEEQALEPIAEPGSPPVRTEDFPAAGAPLLLRDMRIGDHDDFERVVFEFDGDPEDLSYEIEAADVVRATSGEAVDVRGDYTLRVTMTPASGVDLSGSEPVVTYTGEEEVNPTRTSAIAEVTQVEDFESTLTWAIGLVAERQIAVEVLADPPRLVIDVTSG